MLHKLFYGLLIFIQLATALPLESRNQESEIQSAACVICHYLRYSSNDFTGSLCSGLSCKSSLNECATIRSLHGLIHDNTELTAGLNTTRAIIGEAASICSNDETALVISKDLSFSKCSMCLAVYDTLKNFNYNVLENEKLIGEAANAIDLLCSTLEPPVCEVLYKGGALDILSALKESLGGIYDLIAVQFLKCPEYKDLFETC